MHNNLPFEIPDLLVRHKRCVRPGIVLIKHDSSPFDFFFVSSLLQMVQNGFMIDG
uniref:Uncharacterized protein n=1 Tax=Lepeophtheirus salmonis TaxID=72036 RepID=A0A0K2TVY4_LEPSM